MIETNWFQILNPDIWEVISDQRRDQNVQITYMHKEMRRSTFIYPPVLPAILTIVLLCGYCVEKDA